MQRKFEEKIGQSRSSLDGTTEKLSEIQNNIHHVEQKIRLTESEKKLETEASSIEIKKNDLEIKQLMMEVKEIEVHMKLTQKADENVVAKEFQKHSRNIGNFKGKAAKESINLMDAEVLELGRKCKAFEHELQLLKRAFLSSSQQLKEMETKCDEDFENEPTEFDNLQRIRELENEQQKVNRDIVENEVAQRKYRTIKEHLETNKMSYPSLYLEVEKEYEALHADSSLLNIGGIENPEIILQNEFMINSQIGGGDCEPGIDKKNALSENKETQSPIKNFVAPDAPSYSDQQKELQNLQEKFERLKEFTQASDIRDVERRILVQKSMHEDLSDLKKRLMKSVHELKIQKKQLDSRMALMRGVNTDESKRQLNSELVMTKNRYEEQEKRRSDARAELDKLSSLLAEIECRERKIVDFLEEYPPQAMAIKSKSSAKEISKKIEDVLKLIFKKKS